MARTAKTLQHALFAKLRTAFTGKDVGRHAIDIDAPRWIQGTAEEQDALTRGKVLHSVEVLGHGPLALLEWGGRKFGAVPRAFVVGAPEGEWFAAGPMNKGLGMLLLLESCSRVSATPEEIVDKAFGRSGAFDWDEISPLFESGLPVEFQPAHHQRKLPELWSILQATCARMFVSARHPRWLYPFEDRFAAICEGDAARFAGDALLSAALSTERHQAFLHLYRTFEGLFRVMLIEAFLRKIAHPAPGPRNDVDEAVQKELLWRLRGDQAIIRLVAEIDALRRQEIGTLLGVGSEPDKIGRIIYEIRNRVAHGSIFYQPPAIPDGTLDGCLHLLEASFAAIPIPVEWVPDAIR
jgi:hypothetical protein